VICWSYRSRVMAWSRRPVVAVISGPGRAGRGSTRCPRPGWRRHAERLFGDPDYLLRVVARDLDSFAALRDQKLATLPGIHRLTSTIVMKRIVDNRPLPLATRDR
jgi:DNA-binding Lrp family transcriptional regulator